MFFPLASIANSTSVTLQWDPVVEPDIAGYKIYYGTEPQNFSYMIDVGNIAEYTVSDLTKGVKYYFAITAYNEYGLESDFSNVISIPIHVISPNNYKVMYPGKTYKITWESILEAVKFKLFYSVDDGLSWYLISEDFVEGTSYNWTVPMQRGNKFKCFIKVVGYDFLNNIIGEDISDLPFVIKLLKLSPDIKGETLITGTTKIISWITYSTPDPVSKTQIYYRTDDSLPWILIMTFTGNPGSAEWNVPYLKEMKDKCRVKVVIRDTFGGILGAVQSGYFTIKPPE